MNASGKLAIDGGTRVRTTPMPSRGLLDRREKDAVMALFDAAISSGNAFGYNGPSEKTYEADFVEFMGGGYADAVNSGTNAVYVALGALQLDALSEVIVPPITDPGGVMPVPLLGCVPVVADAAPGSYNTGVDQIRPLINERTRAILVAHIAGDVVDMDPIMDLAEKHGLYVVEDCAQSHGATCKGRLAGTIGHIAAFSTMFGKHHCTGGQGGVVYTRDEALHWEGRRFADRGKPFNLQAGGNVRAGLNCNLNDLSAVIGSVQIKKLPDIVKRRVRVGNAVRDALKGQPVRVAWQVPDSQSTYWFIKMHVDEAALTVDKAAFCRALAAEGIPLNPSYRHIPCEAPWFVNKNVFGKSGFPWNSADYTGPRDPVFDVSNAVAACATLFNISITESCGEAEIEDIITAVRKVTAAYAK